MLFDRLWSRSARLVWIMDVPLDFIGPIIDRAPRWGTTCLVLVVALLAGVGCVWLALRYSAESLALRGSDESGAPSAHDAQCGWKHARFSLACVVREPAYLAGVFVYALVAVAFHWRNGWTVGFFAMFMGGGMLLALAVIDARTSVLPDALTLPLLWLGLAVAWLGGLVSLHDAVAGAVAGYGFLWLLFQMYRLVRGRDGMGYGDFKLLAALGAWLGPRSVMLVLLTACLAGLLFACAHQRTLRPAGAYPFGPFLTLAGAGFLLAQCIL